MSEVTAIDLYIVCKNVDQANEVIAEAEKDRMLDRLFMGQGSRQDTGDIVVWLESVDSELYDEDVLTLDSWLKDKFGLRVCGYWECHDDDVDSWRCEVHNGKISFAHTDWLGAYTVKQIRDIKKYAESKFGSK